MSKEAQTNDYPKHYEIRYQLVAVTTDGNGTMESIEEQGSASYRLPSCGTDERVLRANVLAAYYHMIDALL